MHKWLGATLTYVVLSVPLDVHAAPIPPVPENPLQAQTALGFNPKALCPDLRIVDAGTMAVVVFWLPSNGDPVTHLHQVVFGFECPGFRDDQLRLQASIRSRNHARQRRPGRLMAADCLQLGKSSI